MCLSIPAVNYGEEGSMLNLLKSKCVSSPDKPLMFQTGLNPSPQSPAQCMLAYVKEGSVENRMIFFDSRSASDGSTFCMLHISQTHCQSHKDMQTPSHLSACKTYFSSALYNMLLMSDCSTCRFIYSNAKPHHS